MVQGWFRDGSEVILWSFWPTSQKFAPAGLDRQIANKEGTEWNDMNADWRNEGW